MSRRLCLPALLGTFIALLASAPARSDDAPPAPVAHRLMVCEYSDAAHRLLELSAEGKKVWEYKFPSVAVCFRIAPDGTVFFADGGNPTGVRGVDRDGKTVFDYRAKCEQVLCFDLLPSGNLLLAEEGPCRAVEVNRAGEVVSTMELKTSEKPAHHQVRCIHRLDDGHLLACHEGEAVVREYDRDGNVVWEYPHVTDVFEALRLPGGNTLIGCGTQKRVIEVSPAKEVVWELTAKDAPELNLAWVTSLQVLDNGNFVIANFLRGHEGQGAHAFEVTHDKAKKIVWTYSDHQMARSITMARMLDDKVHK